MSSSFGVLKQGIFPESLPLVGGLCFCHTSTIFVIAYSVGVALHGDPDPKCRAGVLLFFSAGTLSRKNRVSPVCISIQNSNIWLRCVKLCVPGPTANCHYPRNGVRSLRCGGSLAPQVISVAGIARAAETKGDTGMSEMCHFPSRCFTVISFYHQFRLTRFVFKQHEMKAGTF